MSIYRELSYHDQDISNVLGIQFTLTSPDEIRARSVAEITTTHTYSESDAVLSGLFDPRMGVIEYNKICVTCSQKASMCPGHFGHIELAHPCFYIQFFDTVRKLLRCVCFRCSRILEPIEDLYANKIIGKKMQRQKRFDQVYKLCTKNKNRTCSHCNSKQPEKVTKENIGRIIMEWKVNPDENVDDPSTATESPHKQLFYANDVLAILKRIPDEDADALGFNKKLNAPEWMICTVFPVPPPAVRPSVRNDTGQRSEDDLTHKLSDIVKTNNTLRQKIEKNANKDQIDHWLLLLQWHVSTFVDNQIPGVGAAKHRTGGRPFRVLRDRLRSKEGRIRGNLMGKRVDFSARSVVSPDPNISIDELGVPMKVAINMTVPEVVNAFNIDELRQLVRNGPDVYPGAKYIRKMGGVGGYRVCKVKSVEADAPLPIDIVVGDVVDRHMRNGDYVLFNRQPSLHKMSMMAHRVKVMPYDTFRLNVQVTPAFNADFDGDEMNAHLPQSVQTENEIIQLASVPTQIINPRDSSPLISVVQDILLGLYRLTKGNTRVNEKQFFNLMAINSKFHGILSEPADKKLRKWTGRQVLSTILPPTLNIRMANGQYDQDVKKDDPENFVVIENGIVKQGTFDKGIYQSQTNGIVHTIVSELGIEEARALFDNTQRLICHWLVYSGFSVGVSDLIIDASTQEKITAETNEMKRQVYEIIRNVHNGTFKNTSIKSNAEFFEESVNNILNNASKNTGKIGRSVITDDNRMINMVKSKSKGNDINVAQMIACLGQQNVEGKRIANGFDDRTLPHFTRYDDGPNSRGFVESSFIKGLTPQELFFHAMGGREGLIDTAVRTSDTGYLQRKLVKAMEDCKISYDLTVRNASGCIVQYLYGEDGISGTKLEKHTLSYIDMDMPKLEFEYLVSAKDQLEPYLTMKTAKELKKTADWKERCWNYFQRVLDDREFVITRIFKGTNDKVIHHPVSFVRIIRNAAALFHTDKARMPSDLSPLYVIDQIEAVCANLKLSHHHHGNMMLGILMRHFLGPKQMIWQNGFNRMTFDYILEQVRIRFLQSIAHPSEMVGVVSAQSIGEPTTQMTLNSVHYDTELLLKHDTRLKRHAIGAFIDEIVESADASQREDHPQDTVLVWLKEPVYVPSCETSGKVSWQRVEAVTRHPVVNEDGTNTLLKVTTHSGREVIATKAKSFLKRVNNEIIGVNGSDLAVGDYLPVSKVLETNETDELTHWNERELTYDEGLSMAQNMTRFPAELLAANQKFLRGVLAHPSLNISCDDINLILLRLGGVNNGDDEDVVPDVQTEQWGTLQLSRSEVSEYLAKATTESDIAVLQRILDEDIFYDRIESIEEVANSREWVYDLTVENTRTFNLYNQLCQMDTFHSSGQASASKVVRGVPRIKELLSVSEKIKGPSMTIYLKEPFSKDLVTAQGILNNIETTYLRDVLVSSRIYFDPTPQASKIEDDAAFLQLYQTYSELTTCDPESPWLLRLELDKAKLFDLGITMLDLQYIINATYDKTVYCEFSDDNADKLIFRIHLTNPDSEDAITDLKALEQNLLDNLIIKGISNIHKVIPSKNDKPRYNSITKTFEKQPEWVLYTDGINFDKVLSLPQVDSVRTLCNDVNEIHRHLGIEAARQCLINEIMDVLSDAGASINYRHISLLTDVMTYRGNLLSIDRHGINRSDIGPLAKCSFEMTSDMLIKAGLFAEYDPINGVSANIMLGQIPPCGTGDTKILLDEDKLMKMAPPLSTIDESDEVKVVDECSKENLQFAFQPMNVSAASMKPKMSVKVV
jgi:DNA-directed RNA polymerase II subunit RPB1